MTNPFAAALNSKLGMKLQGKSIVDNDADPTSAVSQMRRATATLSNGNPQTTAMNNALRKTRGTVKLGVGLGKSI